MVLSAGIAERFENHGIIFLFIKHVNSPQNQCSQVQAIHLRLTDNPKRLRGIFSLPFVSASQAEISLIGLISCSH